MASSVGHGLNMTGASSDGDRAQAHLACRMPPFSRLSVSILHLPFPAERFSRTPSRIDTAERRAKADLGTCSAGLFHSAAPSTAPTGEATREPPATTVRCP